MDTTEINGRHHRRGNIGLNKKQMALEGLFAHYLFIVTMLKPGLLASRRQTGRYNTSIREQTNKLCHSKGEKTPEIALDGLLLFWKIRQFCHGRSFG